MRAVPALTVLGIALAVSACAPPPPDQIVEIEAVRSGNGLAVSVETEDGNEWVLRRGLPCQLGDRLWGDDGIDGDRQGCADKNDQLIEQNGARNGDPEDIEHEGEESSDPDSDDS